MDPQLEAAIARRVEELEKGDLETDPKGGRGLSSPHVVHTKELEDQIERVRHQQEAVEAQNENQRTHQILSRDLPDGTAACLSVNNGDSLLIQNVSGAQIASLWACGRTAPFEGLSTAKTRAALRKIHFEGGDELLTTRRKPIIRFENNCEGGLHDNSLPASVQADSAMRDALRRRGVKVTTAMPTANPYPNPNTIPFLGWQGA